MLGKLGSKRAKKPPEVPEEGSITRRSGSGSAKVVEVPRGKSAKAAAAAAAEAEAAADAVPQEQTTKVVQDVRPPSLPPARLAAEDIGRFIGRLVIANGRMKKYHPRN